MRKFVRSDGSVGVGRLICSFEQRSNNSQVFYNGGRLLVRGLVKFLSAVA